MKEKAADEFAKYIASDIGTRANSSEFEDLNIAVYSLHLHEQQDTVLEEYKDILTNPYKRHDHKRLIKLLQTDEAIDKELGSLKKKTYEFKLIQTTAQKSKSSGRLRRTMA